MTHRFPDFTSHVLDLLKNTGPSGPTGPTLGKPFIPNEKSWDQSRSRAGTS
ncbi:hypothetical protein ACVWZ3_008083 [Bradyrhizobium sp. i1.3.6]